MVRFFQVHTQYRPLRLNVGFLLSQTAGYGRQFDFREPKLNFGGDLQVESFSGSVMLSRTAQGIVAQGDFAAELHAECARCLKPFSVPVSIHLEDLFVYPPQNATDPLLSVGEDAHLNLEPLLREYILINQPSRPLHKPDCKGLCSVCGADLNEEPNHHHKEEGAPIFTERILVRAAESQGRITPAAAAGPASAPPKRTAVKVAAQRKKEAPKRKSGAAAAPKKKTTGGKKTTAGKKSAPGGKRKTSTKK
jgi:uncharacterized protein